MSNDNNLYPFAYPKIKQRKTTLQDIAFSAIFGIVVTSLVIIISLFISKSNVSEYFNLNAEFSAFPAVGSSKNFKTALDLLKDTPFSKIDNLEKWTTSIKVKYEGKFNKTDIGVLKKIFKSFNSVKGFPDITLVKSGENVVLSYIESSDFLKYAKKYDKDKNNPVSFCYHESIADNISKGHIIIIRNWPQSYQNSEVLHEFFHLIGFYNHTDQTNSILNKKGPVSSLSQADLLAFKMVYNPEIKPGMTFKQIKKYYGKQKISKYVSKSQTAAKSESKPDIMILLISVGIILLINFGGSLRKREIFSSSILLLTGAVFSAIVFVIYFVFYSQILSIL